MTLHKAQQIMENKWQLNGKTYHVVYDPTYKDESPENSYYVCDDNTLDTFFNGVKVIQSLEY